MQIQRSTKQIAVILFSLFVVLPAIGLLLLSVVGPRPTTPPRESTVLANFYAHRAVFEQLHAMLDADKPVEGVAGWGVQTANSPLWVKPPEGGLSISRFHEYLTLLREIGAQRAGSEWEEHREVGIGVWRSGFAGESRHINVVWLDYEPPNTIGNLDDFYKTPTPRSPVYRHIDGHWYIWADW